MQHISDHRRRLILAALASPAAAWAQGISNRPVRFVLGQTPATTPDLIARTLAPRMQAKWHQPFIVENRGGAGGAIGLDAVAKAPPDGHTITVSVNSTLTLPLFFKIDFDVLNSFTPISVLAQNIFVLVVHPSVPARSFPEFVEWAKREGANANYGSPGNGTHHHLIMESVGKIHSIGGSARERSPLGQQIPSLHEQGLKDFDYFSWFSAWGPAGMAQDIVAKYNTAFREVMAEPEVRDTLAKQGVSPRLSTPQELDQLNRADYAALVKLVKDAKIKGD